MEVSSVPAMVFGTECLQDIASALICNANNVAPPCFALLGSLGTRLHALSKETVLGTRMQRYCINV